MIVSAYGMTSMSPMELASMLASLKITFGMVHKATIQKHRGEWPSQILFPVIFTSATSFLQTYRKFKTSRVVAFVMDNPFTLSRELSLPLLGAEVTGLKVTVQAFGIDELRSLLGRDVELKEPLDFRRRPYTPFREVMDKYAGSDLGKIQTFLYRVKDTEVRKKVNKAVKTWMVNDRSLKSLEREVRRIAGETVWLSLQKVVDSDSIGALRQAILKAKDNPGAINRIAKELKISPFDIRYLLATK